jgi:hypothetical protein
MSTAQLGTWAADVHKTALKSDTRTGRLEECLRLITRVQASPVQAVAMVVQSRCIGPCQTRLRGGYCHSRKWITLDPQPTAEQLVELAEDKYIETRSVSTES